MSDLSYYTNADKYPSTYLSSPLLPVILSAATGYLVAQMFFSVRHCFNPVLSAHGPVQLPTTHLLQVYEMAIDTILLSFCEDSESHGGTPQYAPPLLLNAIGQAKLAKQYKAEAKQHKADAKAAKKQAYADRVNTRGLAHTMSRPQAQARFMSSHFCCLAQPCQAPACHR